MIFSSLQRKGAKLGQHFLKAKWAARKLVQAASARGGEPILEIGPGKGALTRELLTLGNTVIAIEKDTELVAYLHAAFADEIASGRLRIVSQDIRAFVPESVGLEAGKYVLAANIPYYITGEIIRQFLTTERPPHTMAILIQKEVAQRICAHDGKESILSLSVQAYGTPRIVAKVGKSEFSPPPSVDSAILCVDTISKDFFTSGGITEEAFFVVVKAGFAAKRKMLAGNLSVVFDKEKVASALEQAGIEPKARAEDVPLEKWKAVTAYLTAFSETR